LWDKTGKEMKMYTLLFGPDQLDERASKELAERALVMQAVTEGVAGSNGDVARRAKGYAALESQGVGHWSPEKLDAFVVINVEHTYKTFVKKWNDGVYCKFHLRSIHNDFPYQAMVVIYGRVEEADAAWAVDLGNLGKFGIVIHQ
jgi:hypothetical protein